jgi:hypothetical protein
MSIMWWHEKADTRSDAGPLQKQNFSYGVISQTTPQPY